MAKTIQGPGALARSPEPTDTLRDASEPPERPRSQRRAEPADLVGVVLKEKYELLRILAAGAMGTVFEAKHVALQRRFAVKVLSIDSRQQADALPRFKREAELSSAIGHENIVDVVDIDRTEDDQWYLVMELLQGEELRELMYRERKLPVEDVVAIARQLGSAVDAAHAQGVVHRDLKPENIFVLDRKDEAGAPVVKIVDFGISKVRDAETDLTRPGEVIGTPFYMAPEQARGDRTIDHRADLFALGAVFYEALVGNAPFKGSTPNAVLRSILVDDLPSPKECAPELSDPVCQVLERALAKEPDERFQSGAELAHALAAAVAGESLEPPATPLSSSAPEEPAPAPEEPAAPPTAPTAGGYRGVHLVLAFVTGVILCAAVLALAQLAR